MSHKKDLVQSLRQMSMEELQKELLELRKLQFNLRLKKVNGVLLKSHVIAVARKKIARIKTIMKEKAE